MITSEEARQLYLEEGRTLKEMCPFLDCVNTITASKRLRAMGIETNSNKRTKVKTMRGMDDNQFGEYLKAEYETKSMGEIANELGITPSAVRKYFLKYGIERRSKTDFMKDPAKTPNWNGGRHIKENGYIEVYAPWHPRAKSRPYVYEHVLIMEKHIGRYLANDEVVHHIDLNKSNNDITNLRLMTNSEHVTLHQEIKYGKIRKRTKKRG